MLRKTFESVQEFEDYRRRYTEELRRWEALHGDIERYEELHGDAQSQSCEPSGSDSDDETAGAIDEEDRWDAAVAPRSFQFTHEDILRHM